MTCIRIEREGTGYEVTVTNPDAAKSNKATDGPWTDPNEEYQFDTWAEVTAFLDKVVDKALPPDEYTRAFVQAAKEAQAK